MLGFAHAYFVLGLRHAEGWVGYGTHIHAARYGQLATVGSPIRLECRATQVRRIRGSIYVRYSFRFEQGPRRRRDGTEQRRLGPVPTSPRISYGPSRFPAARSMAAPRKLPG